MSRYKNSKIKKVGNKTCRSTSIYNKIPETNEDVWVITQYGDRLDLLAYQFYGDQSMWWIIAKANYLNTLKVPEGTSLRIPSLDASKDLIQ